MIDDVRPWAPAGAVIREDVRAAVATAVAAWSERWFGRPAAHLSTLSSASAGGDRPGWKRPGRTIAIHHAPKAVVRLAGLALDARLDQLDLTEADQRLIDALGDRLVRDLVGEVEAVFAPSDLAREATTDRDMAADLRDSVHAVLADDQGSPVATLAIPRRLAIAFCRAHLPPPAPATEPLNPIAASLSDQAIVVEADLGRARITLGDLRNLAAGDVLVLDTALNQSLPLRLADGGESGLRGRLTHADSQIALTLEA